MHTGKGSSGKLVHSLHMQVTDFFMAGDFDFTMLMRGHSYEYAVVGCGVPAQAD